MTISKASIAILLLLSACTAVPRAPVPSAPTPRPVVAAPQPASPTPTQKPTGDWLDWPLAPGDWVYRNDARGSIALFGPSGKNADVTIRCDRQRKRVYLSREGQTQGGKITVTTSSAVKEFAAAPTGGAPAYAAVEILPSDPILDAMAFSRGRIAVQADALLPLAIPAWAEIGRVVEDCRA
jgi:hypothetical protein